PTVWSVWGVPQAINAGDGMFAVSRLAVQRLHGFPAERVLEFAKLVDEACVRVCEGQFLDIAFETRTDVTTERYRAMAAKKTGALFAAAAQGAALLSSESVEQIREILNELGVRALIDAEITAQRGRALHALRGIAPIAAAREPLDLLERLVASATGAATEPAGASA